MKPLTYSLFLLLALLIFACGGETKETNSEKPAAPNKEAIAKKALALAEGKKMYNTYCVACHTVDGLPLIADAGNLQESKMTKAEIKARVKYGSENKKMIAFENILSSAQIDAVADYVLTFRK